MESHPPIASGDTEEDLPDMRSDTQTISINAPAEKAFAFVADPGNLPRWAIGFAKAIAPDGDAWLVTTGQGQVRLRAVTDADIGIVDFHMTVGGVEAVAYSRVLARGEACEYVFTQMQPPGMPHDVFDDQVSALGHELIALKALVEVECPL
jgi:Polyketide cyclase / dehydrase and lipid transport